MTPEHSIAGRGTDCGTQAQSLHRRGQLLDQVRIAVTEPPDALQLCPLQSDNEGTVATTTQRYNPRSLNWRPSRRASGVRVMEVLPTRSY